MNKNIAIITGATGGIGKEFVKQMVVEPIDEIWAIARNQEKLAALSEEFGEKICLVSLDLSNIEDIKYLRQKLQQEEPVIRYLVNNAGLAKMGSYNEFSLEEIDATVNVNCKAPVLLCKICIPYMQMGSRIINISSAASFQPTPYINLYAASKVFERSYSRALNVELKDTGITATAVCPSWVDTDLLIHEKNGKKIKFPGIVTANQVVTKALKDAKKGKDMSVCTMYVKCQHFNVKLFPQRMVMKKWMKGIKDYI
jgi:short-subunit dehydrogenase